MITIRSNSESFGDTAPSASGIERYEGMLRDRLAGHDLRFEYLDTLGYYRPYDVSDEESICEDEVSDAVERTFDEWCRTGDESDYETGTI